MDPRNKVLVALDLTTNEDNFRVAEKIAAHETVAGFKVNSAGDEVMYRSDGQPHFLRQLAGLGKELWLDFKLHDVPPTVARRVTEHVKGGLVNAITIMAKGEVDMMVAAVLAAGDNVLIIAVTELTSNSEEQVHLGSGHPAKASVINLARNAVLSGVKYLVCSTQEVPVIVKRKELQTLTLRVPGLSVGGVTGEGQSRIGTMTDLLKVCPSAQGVIGSGIIKAADPLEAVKQVTAEIEAIAL